MNDAFQRQVFTLAPFQLAPSCPIPDFSSISEPSLRIEVTAQYHEFCERVVQSAYRDVPTKARNIVEGIVACKLRTQSQSADRELGKDLKTIKRLLESEATRTTCGWSDLEYHLCHKIRLVHGQTHPGSVTGSGRPIRPEFALSVVEDLVELLRIWGYVST